MDERHNGTLATAVAEALTEAETVAWIVRELDATELTHDCASPLTHAREHKPHPNGGRAVCHICHTPAAVLVSNGSVRR